MALSFYWPRTPEYAIPWMAGPALYGLLGVFGLPGGKPIDLGPVPSSFAAGLLVMVLLLGLNALFLWVHLRPQFLTWNTASARFSCTFFLLTIGNLILWGIVLLLRGDARFSPDISYIDWSFTVRGIDIGLLGFTAVLLVSAMWKSEEPGVSNLRLERENARRLISKLHEGTIQRDEFNDLGPALIQIEESARPLAARLSGPDLDLLGVWRGSAKRLKDGIANFDYNDLTRIREQLGDVVETALEGLKRTR